MNWLPQLLLGLQALIGLTSTAIGGMKLTDADHQIQEFNRYGYPQWARYPTGGLEVGGGLGVLAGLLWPVLTLAGSLTISLVLLGAVATHIRLNDPLPRLALPAGLLAATLLITIPHLPTIP